MQEFQYSFLSIGFFFLKNLNKKVLEQQLEINNLLIVKEKEHSNEQNKAEMRAYKIGSKGNYQLIITNSGKATAENVYLEILIDSVYRGCFWILMKFFPMNTASGHSEKFRIQEVWIFQVSLRLESFR